MDLRFDYNEFWEDTPDEEPEYVEEATVLTDQDFWELHKFVLECEIESYDDIYTESVGSMVKAGFGNILDKIVNAFLRICEAFKKKSMKRAILWLSKNSTIIGRLAKIDRRVRSGLETSIHG
jgi:hypothetical protein